MTHMHTRKQITPKYRVDQTVKINKYSEDYDDYLKTVGTIKEITISVKPLIKITYHFHVLNSIFTNNNQVLSCLETEIVGLVDIPMFDENLLLIL